MFVFTPRAFAVLFVLGERAPTETPAIRLVDVFSPLYNRAAGGVDQELIPAAEISLQVIPCVCGVSFNSKLVWNTHKKSNHKCPECSAVLAGLDSFRRHLRHSCGALEMHLRRIKDVSHWHQKLSTAHAPGIQRSFTLDQSGTPGMHFRLSD